MQDFQENREQILRNELRKRALMQELERRKAQEPPSSLIEKLGYPKDGIAKNLAGNITSLANSPGVHAIQGAQDEFQKAITGGLVNPTPQGEGGAYNLGKYGGDALAAYLGGKALGPFLGKLASPVLKADATQRALSSFQPNKYAENILKDLGNRPFLGENANIPGMERDLSSLGNELPPQSLQDSIKSALSNNAKSIAEDINTRFNEHNNINKEQYESVFNDSNNVGDRRLQIKRAAAPNESPRIVSPEISKTFSGDLEDEYQNFVKDPTVRNAHDFQSELGFTIRRLQNQGASGKLSIHDQKILSEYQKAHRDVREEIHDSLRQAEKEHGEEYLNPYVEANKYHFENVVPYKINSNISKMAHGTIKNPRNIPNTFKNPEDHIQKIVEDLGDDFKNKILYSHMGKFRNNLDAEKLIKEYERLDEKGLSDYITDEIENRFTSLQKKHTRKNIARNAAGLVGGGVLGNALGIPMAKEIGAVGGFLAAPAIEKLISTLARRK